MKVCEDFLPLLCFQMAVDLVDTIEMIDMVLDEIGREHKYPILEGFAYTMVAIACISFLLYRPGKCLKMRLKQDNCCQKEHCYVKFLKGLW